MTLALVIIVKNGAKGIGGAVESVKSLVNEIIIVDSGSTDSTIDRAKKYTQKVYYKKFKNDFSKLRNFAHSKATTDWILVLDADEVLYNNAFGSIPQLIKSLKYDGYWFRRRWYYDGKHYLKHGLFYPDYQLRLFRNKPKYRYIQRVHEELTIPHEKTQQIDADIYHYNKSLTQNPMYTKLAALDFKDLKKPKIWYLWQTIYTFINMFFVALLRGKGILDGWIGIKAHYYFAV